MFSAQMHQKDYYKVLGISKSASQKAIKKAYFDVSTVLILKQNQ